MGEQDEEKLVLPEEKASSKASRNRRRESKKESITLVESDKACGLMFNKTVSMQE